MRRVSEEGPSDQQAERGGRASYLNPLREALLSTPPPLVCQLVTGRKVRGN